MSLLATRAETPEPSPGLPQQDPGEPYPLPDPGVPYPAPDPGVPYPVPDPGVPYPVPDPLTGATTGLVPRCRPRLLTTWREVTPRRCQRARAFGSPPGPMYPET